MPSPAPYDVSKERPILFSGPMVQALLAGRKTQTRRIMKRQPSAYVPGELKHPPKHPGPYFDAYNGGSHWCWWSADDRQGPDWIRCPYGKPGDRLWMREAFAPVSGGAIYRADGERQTGACCGCAWKSPIFMSRALSRLTLEVTDVRVERLHDISEADALAEGIQRWPGETGFHWEPNPGWPGEPEGAKSMRLVGATARNAFLALWEEINGRESLDANPFVWAVSFRRVEAA